MHKIFQRASLPLAIALSVIVSGCGSVTTTQPDVQSKKSNILSAEKVDKGLPSNLPEELPEIENINPDYTYTVKSKNNYFTSTSDTPIEVRNKYIDALRKAGYTVKPAHSLEDGSISIDFYKGNKLGNVYISETLPGSIDPELGTSGTFVNVLYDLTPPPIPALP